MIRFLVRRLLTATVVLWLVMSAVFVLVNVVATDDIVNAAEVASTITGTNEAGATVALSLGGNTRAPAVSGTATSPTSPSATSSVWVRRVR